VPRAAWTLHSFGCSYFLESKPSTEQFLSISFIPSHSVSTLTSFEFIYTEWIFEDCNWGNTGLLAKTVGSIRGSWANWKPNGQPSVLRQWQKRNWILHLWNHYHCPICPKTRLQQQCHYELHSLTHALFNNHWISNSMSCIDLCAFITFPHLFYIPFPSLSFVQHILVPLFLLSNLSFTLKRFR